LVVVILAVGCSRAPDRSAAADSSDAAPGSQPAGPATGGPAAPSVTEQGIGPLRAGMTLSEATTALGGALVVPAGADTAGCTYVEWRGGPPGVRVMVEGGRIARVDVTTPGTATATGARVGDSEERVMDLYRGRVAVTPLKYEEGHYLTVTPESRDTSIAIVFEAANGKIARYRAGQRPQVEYVEGCG
jgi:hypothetical protein